MATNSRTPTRIDDGHRAIAEQGGSENQYRYAYYVCILENGTRHRICLFVK